MRETGSPPDRNKNQTVPLLGSANLLNSSVNLNYKCPDCLTQMNWFNSLNRTSQPK